MSICSKCGNSFYKGITTIYGIVRVDHEDNRVSPEDKDTGLTEFKAIGLAKVEYCKDCLKKQRGKLLKQGFSQFGVSIIMMVVAGLLSENTNFIFYGLAISGFGSFIGSMVIIVSAFINSSLVEGIKPESLKKDEIIYPLVDEDIYLTGKIDGNHTTRYELIPENQLKKKQKSVADSNSLLGAKEELKKMYKDYKSGNISETDQVDLKVNEKVMVKKIEDHEDLQTKAVGLISEIKDKFRNKDKNEKKVEENDSLSENERLLADFKEKLADFEEKAKNADNPQIKFTYEEMIAVTKKAIDELKAKVVENDIKKEETSELKKVEKIKKIIKTEKIKNEEKIPLYNSEQKDECMLCSKCGKEIPKASKFCPYCRTQIVSGDNNIETKLTKNGIFKNKKIIFSIAAALVLIIAVIIIVPGIQKSTKYNNAIKEMENGNYSEAISIFDEMNKEDYKDSQQYLIYSYGLQDLENGDYESALYDFNDIPDFKDSASYISLVEAMAQINDGNYEDALSCLNDIADFKDASLYKKLCEGFIAFNDGDYSLAKENLNTLSNSNLPNNIIEESNQMISLINGIEKFNNNDFTCKSDFESIVDSESDVVKNVAGAYLKCIEGIEYFEQGLFYSAYKCFNDCKDIDSISQLKELCFQERPASGVIYRNTTSSSVSVTIYDTKDEDDMFVKIYDPSDNLIETMYIRDGGNATASFQSGTFRMAIAYGDPEWWFGTEEAYGTYGSYKRLLLTGNEEYYTFQANNVYTLKFNVSNGNVNDRKSNYGDF